ncbi:MAG: TMEM143 family protein [Chromatiales bacterium]|nr:TMEM143 family protein [Chromatiales bacterium]
MIKQESNKNFRFIPYRKHDIVEMCLQDNKLSSQEKEFRDLYYMLGSIFHFEFHQVIEALKDSYAPVDPDSDTRPYNNAPLDNRSFVELLGGLLEKANYERVTEADLNQALNEASLFKIRLHVDFEDFSEVLLFCRGESIKQETISGFMGLFSKTIEFTNYERVVVYIRFKETYEQSTGRLSSKPGSTLLKLFQNVPKADLEMLFPNTCVRMRTIDKLLIGIPALVSGGIILTTKLSASLILLGSLFGFWLGLSSQPVELNKTALMALLAGLGALGGYLWKQFNNFKNRKLRFMQELTQNLYFKNLDNNAGVFHRLANDAEEEENKEAILAYYFLLISDHPLSKKSLDQKIEHWFSSKWECEIDFEIDDALEKLIALELIESANGKLTAISIESAIKKLDYRWDNYFVPPET